MRDIMTPEMALGALDKVTITMSAQQWEGIAAMQQYRMFAIHDLAETIEPDLRALAAGEQTAAEKIMDLCRLPHAELVKKGLLS